LPNGLEILLSAARGISELIDLHSVAVFFEIRRLERYMIGLVGGYLVSAWKNSFLIFSDRTMGSPRFRQINIYGELEQTAGAIERAGRLIPRDSYMWILCARYLLTMRQVIDGTDGTCSNQVNRIIARLNLTVPFAHACLEVNIQIRPASLKGVFRSAVDWDSQCEICACTGCDKVIFPRDLVERKANDLAAGAVQEFALVNPFDGYRTMFCGYCRNRCGVPWGGNRPCMPHE
jgi:hypothetical protein